MSDVVAACSWNAASGTVGKSVGIVSIVSAGAGLFDITLAAPAAADSGEYACIVTERGLLAGSGMSSFGVTHTSDLVKRVSCLREAPAGAASVLTNIAADFVMVRFANTYPV